MNDPEHTSGRGRAFAPTCLIITLTLFLVAVPVTAQDRALQAGRLKVIVTGLAIDEGQVRIGLYDSAQSYKSAKKPFKGAAVNIRNKRAEYVFDNLPYGTYAMRLYHDQNGNGKLDRAASGMPTEPYGFSGTVSGTFGAPEWEAARFTIESKPVTMEIRLE
jgi:uncharacterized protein (DUF2141 family)